MAVNVESFEMGLVVAALHADLTALRALAPRGDGLGAPIDPSELGPLGPLWPAGTPTCFAPHG